MQVSKAKTISKVVAYILVAIILVGTIGLVYRFTNGFNEDFKTFYIEYDGKQILTTDSKMTIKAGQKYAFNVKYTFDNGSSEPKDYNVKIVPNVEKDFDFTVDGERYLYSKEKDLTAGFGLTKNDTSFELNLREDFSLKTVLQSVYANKTVVISNEALESNVYPFKLVVSSYNESVVYNIKLGLDVKVTGVEFDKDEITFIPDGTTPETPTPSEPDTPVTPEEQGQYFIEYDTLGNGSVLSVNFNCQATANAGDKVEFTVSLTADSSDLEITNIRLENCDTGDELDEPDYSNGVYSFNMPDCNVTVMIYLMRI